MRKIAIIGAGNVGIAAAKALLESPDMELCGFIRRKSAPVPDFEIRKHSKFGGYYK